MKKITIISISLWFIIGCSEPKKLENKTDLLVSTNNGHRFLNLTKSKYYPKTIKSFSQLVMPYGKITIDSTNEELAKVKFWLADSILSNLAERENLIYKKTYFLDTMSKDEIFNFSKGFEVKSTSKDTATLQLKVKELNLTPEEIEEKWSLKINCHFDNRNGTDYDTTFYANFNERWMKNKLLPTTPKKH